MIKIFSINDLNKKQKDDIVAIFFETSAKKNFKDAIEKEKFYYRYLGYYLNHHADLFFVGLEGDQVLGYICGVLNSSLEQELYELLPHYALFSDYFSDFPAHLHINLASGHRGKGIGSKLIHYFESTIKSKGGSGVHLITTVDALNVQFYLRNSYIYRYTETLYGNKLLLMGKKLI